MTMVLRSSWVLLVVLLFSSDAYACSCGGGPFLTVGPSAELVVRAKVLKYSSYAMDVEVQEVFKGNSTSKTIRVWGDSGALCRPYVSQFPIGTEWVFAVQSNKSEGDYAISVCGEFALKVEKDNVSGRLSSMNYAEPSAKPETMSLKEFRERLKAAAK